MSHKGLLPKYRKKREQIGTAPSRVNHFVNKFNKLGFMHTNGARHVNSSLLGVVLHD
jgi:CRP/FNR family transcriptional regulator, cyclic AMP receptor protein